MKKLFFSVLLLLIARFAFSQTDDGRSMSPILKAAIPNIELVESKGLEIVRMEYDILKDQKETYRYLYEGWTYGVWAFGDYRVEDIDVEVYKQVGNEWSLIANDKDASSNAVVTVKPLYTGMYKIVVKGYKFAPGANGCHYGLLIFHE